MKNHLVLKKHISIVVLICFLVSQFGCVAYRPDEFKYSDHSIPLDPNKSIFLKKGDRLWEVVSLKMDDEVILFEILEQFNSERELSFVNYPRAHRVFILIHPGTNLDFNEDQQVQLPFSAIQEIQYYDVDEVRTAGLNFLTSIILLSVMASILVPEPKPEPEPAPSSGGGSSCPFIYVNNGSEYSFSGEIYSGAILPPIERHDYLPLPEITSLNGEYQLKITNEVHEIQHTNLIQLNAFDHPIDTKVLIDRHGTRHMLQSSFSEALSATNEMGVDILSELSETDRNLYIGDIRTDLSPLERLHLSFPIDKGQESAALVLNGRNSWWLDFMVREYFENFGGYYGKLIEKQSKISAEKINEWSIDQGIFLSVYIEKENGWNFVDYYNPIGPMAFKEDVLNLDLSGINEETVNIKLEYGTMFWEIDRASLATPFDGAIIAHQLPLISASDESGANIINLLTVVDDRYYVQPNIGDKAFCSFSAPDLLPGMKRTVLLHSKGYYEILCSPSENPDLSFLLSQFDPNAFSKFSQGNLNALLDQFRIK